MASRYTLPTPMISHWTTKLIPFFISSAVYLVVFTSPMNHPLATLGMVVFKILPILSLCTYVISQKKTANTMFPVFSWINPENGDLWLALGLLFSSLGDIFMIWEQLFFVPALVFFTAGHLFYIAAFQMRKEPGHVSNTWLLFVIWWFICIMLQWYWVASRIIQCLAMLYTTIMFAMSWRATSKYEAEGTRAALAGCVGAVLFCLSDFLLGVNKWIAPLPLSDSLIIIYFAGQFGIALSATTALKNTYF